VDGRQARLSFVRLRPVNHANAELLKRAKLVQPTRAVHKCLIAALVCSCAALKFNGILSRPGIRREGRTFNYRKRLSPTVAFLFGWL
jgi:hypothetical protein